jgi:GNAT superfamily N-acetyltransferase
VRELFPFLLLEKGRMRRRNAMVHLGHDRVSGASLIKARTKENRATRLAFSIRRGTVRDVPIIFDLMRGLAEYEGLRRAFQATRPRLRRDGFGRRPYFHTLVCRRRRVPVGFALYFFSYSTFLARPTLYLEDLYVLPRYRGQGAGTALFAALARIAVRKRCGRMEWAVLRVNAPAIRFYNRLGATLRREWVLTRLAGDPLPHLARGAR